MAGTVLVQQLQAKDLLEDRAENAVAAIRVAAIARAAVITVFITTAKTLTEVMLILAQFDVVTVVSVARILIGVRVIGIEAPAVLTVSLACLEAFAVTVVDRATQHLRAVLARLVVAAATLITIVVRSIVVVTPLLQSQLIAAQPLEITLLKAQLVDPALLFEQALALRKNVLSSLPILAITRRALFLFVSPVALAPVVVAITITAAVPIAIPVAIAI